MLLLILVPFIPLVIIYKLMQYYVQFVIKPRHHVIRSPDDSGDNLQPVVGFFHPYCNAGGGGERVLWTAIRALQNKYPKVRCVIYTGDTDATAEQILNTAKQRFNIAIPRIDEKSLAFVFLKKRYWVEAVMYPYFTLLGQSLGSMLLGFEAMMKFVPDIYIDTMGYAFTLPMFKYIAQCKVACYVHYPTISTDMLKLVANRVASYNNTGIVSRSPILSKVKLLYYNIFAYLYGLAGKSSDIVMVNSSWTKDHIDSIWHVESKTFRVYPPCDTKEFLSMPLKEKDDAKKIIVSVAQFRPEKDHPLQINAFNEFLKRKGGKAKEEFCLQLVGSCRNKDDSDRVENLKNLGQKLGILDSIEFKLNVPFSELKESLNNAHIGLHTMWNEHFGIGVVECMAAGTIILAHNSGGPKLDIVVDFDGKKTGYLADSVESYADAMEEIFSLSHDETLNICENARQSVQRFSEENFITGFIDAVKIFFHQ